MMRVDVEFPGDAYRAGDAVTGSPSGGQPVVWTPIELTGHEYGRICFGYSTAIEIGSLVGMVVADDLKNENSRLKMELEAERRKYAALVENLKIQAHNLG